MKALIIVSCFMSLCFVLSVQRKDDREVSVETTAEGITHLSGSVSIRAAKDSIWSLLAGYDRLCDFVPNLKESRIIKSDSSGIALYQRGTGGFWIFTRTVETVLIVRETYPVSIDFRQIKGDFKYFRGSWRIGEAAGGGICTVRYDAEMIPSFRAPNFVIQRIQKKMLSELLEIIRMRLESNSK